MKIRASKSIIKAHKRKTGPSKEKSIIVKVKINR
jgi:hypothetical protein